MQFATRLLGLKDAKGRPIDLPYKNKVLEFPGGLEVKDPILSPLWCGFDPWSGNFGMCRCGQKINKVLNDFLKL